LNRRPTEKTSSHDPARGAFLRERLKELRGKYAAPKAATADKKASKDRDMDDEIPW
jgi:hypothetical protein